MAVERRAVAIGRGVRGRAGRDERHLLRGHRAAAPRRGGLHRIPGPVDPRRGAVTTPHRPGVGRPGAGRDGAAGSREHDRGRESRSPRRPVRIDRRRVLGPLHPHQCTCGATGSGLRRIGDGTGRRDGMRPAVRHGRSDDRTHRHHRRARRARHGTAVVGHSVHPRTRGAAPPTAARVRRAAQSRADRRHHRRLGVARPGSRRPAADGDRPGDHRQHRHHGGRQARPHCSRR